MTERDDSKELGLDDELSSLDPAEEAVLMQALALAFHPTELAPERHELILREALEDPFAEATEEELRESERLRHALETEDSTHADAALARALAAAIRPPPVPESIETRARGAALERSRRTNVVYVTFGAIALSLAAAFALLLGNTQPQSSAQLSSKPVPAPALAQSRSTNELFDERFAGGQATARVDRIAEQRARELRDNRYALWGVR
jgi:hypothetical protein